MEISFKNEDYKFLKTLTDNSVEECVEAELTLPEYMPEILRIIKSTAEPKINSCRLVGERVTVDGVCDLRMIYTAEDGCIYCFSQSRPFTRHCENAAFTEAVDVNSKVGVSYVNCRATGTKRAEIKAGLVIKFCVYCEEKEEVISLNNTKEIEQKTIPVRAMSLGCRKTRSFSMSDTITLNSPAAFLISSRASAVCTEIRKINNKIMIKGDAIIDVCYVNANDKTSAEHIKHSIPINQILEFDGMEERFTGDVVLQVTALDVMLKGESTGIATAFDISLGVDASVSMWEEKELLVISDAYAVGAALELKKAPFSFYTASEQISDKYVFDGNFPVNGEGVGSIIDCCGEITGAQVKVENGELAVCGSLSVSLIIKDSAGSLSGISKMFDYVYKRKTDVTDKNIVCVPDLTLLSLDCTVKGANSIDVRAEIGVTGSVFVKLVVDAVTDIVESETPVSRSCNAITVYFPESSNESLWSIARRYNTTVKAIAEENDLEGDTTENLKMIFIPSA